MSFGQGGPGWGPEGSSGPDWEALAEESERDRARRRRWWIIGGGALAAVAVGAVVAFGVIGTGGDKPSDSLPSPSQLTPSTDQPSPSFSDEPPPPPPPIDFISTAKRDRAPLSARTLYPAAKMTVNGRSYTRHAVATSKQCGKAANPDLAGVLRKHGCMSLYRATFTGGGLAVTIGIAAFDDAATAAQVKQGYKPNILALPGHGVHDFCRTVTCRTGANSFGRYTYFTISGRADGKASTRADHAAVQASLDGLDYAYSRVLARGKDQSEAAASPTGP